MRARRSKSLSHNPFAEIWREDENHKQRAETESDSAHRPFLMLPPLLDELYLDEDEHPIKIKVGIDGELEDCQYDELPQHELGSNRLREPLLGRIEVLATAGQPQEPEDRDRLPEGRDDDQGLQIFQKRHLALLRTKRTTRFSGETIALIYGKSIL